MKISIFEWRLFIVGDIEALAVHQEWARDHTYNPLINEVTHRDPTSAIGRQVEK